MKRTLFKPGLWQLVLCGLSGTTSLIIALNLDPVTQRIQGMFFLAAAIIFGATWAYAMVIFFLWSYADVQSQLSEAKFAGERDLTRLQNEQMIILERLPSDRVALVGKLRAAIMIHAVEKTPEFTLNLGDRILKYKHVDAFMAQCSPVWLCPIGTFSDDTIMRDAAEVMTNFFINENYAEEARGRRPAKWIDYEGACARVAWSPTRRYVEMVKGTETGA